MGTNVFINNREACCKASKGKSTAAFPDPCWSPPQSTPIVIPYPNTAFARDLKKGTSTVFIRNSIVAQKDRSYFCTSQGNEPATPTLAKGVVSHKIKGKAYFKSWCANVKFEGREVPRHLDLMTHNHGSSPNTMPHVFISEKAGDSGVCKKDVDLMEQACPPNWKELHCHGLQHSPESAISRPQAFFKSFNQLSQEKQSRLSEETKQSITKLKNNKATKKEVANVMTEIAKLDSCLTAKRCILVPYRPKKGCCPGQTGHHVLPGAMFYKNIPNYINSDTPAHKHAPTICVEGTSNHDDWGSHGRIHQRLQDKIERYKNKPGEQCNDFSYDKACKMGIKSITQTFPESGCTPACLRAQLDGYYSKLNVNNDTKLNANSGKGGAQSYANAFDKQKRTKTL